MDVTQGIPIGLIVNEVITNSFKYAFDKRIPAPEVVVTLAAKQGLLRLLISDNGIGFDRRGDGMPGHGLKLVQGLTGQIGGQVTIRSSRGTKVCILFRQKDPVAAAARYD